MGKTVSTLNDESLDEYLDELMYQTPVFSPPASPRRFSRSETNSGFRENSATQSEIKLDPRLDFARYLSKYSFIEDIKTLKNRL